MSGGLDRQRIGPAGSAPKPLRDGDHVMPLDTAPAASGVDKVSRVRFHHLTFLDEGEDVVVGRPDLDSYVVIPADGATLLRRLYAGDDLESASAWYAETFGESVDVDDFVDSLRDLDFLRTDEDVPSGPRPAGADSEIDPPADQATDSDTRSTGPAVRWQRLGAIVFGRTAMIGYLAVVVAGVAVALANPAFAPHYGNVFFTGSLILIELSMFVLQFPLVLVHELAHVLAGRRLGLRTKVRLSRRLYFLVFETVMNGLVSVPRSRRYLPMLAGMLADLVMAAGFTVAAWLLRQPGDDIGLPSRLLLALAFTTLLRILWQLYFFLRTDVYYLISTVLGCVDLHTTSRQYLANIWFRLIGRDDRRIPPESWHPRDRRAARWYAPLVVLGYTLAIGLAVLVMLPIVWTFLSTAIERAFLGGADSSPQAWDALLVLGLNALQIAVAGVLALRERRTTRPRPRHRAVGASRPGRHRATGRSSPTHRQR